MRLQCRRYGRARTTAAGILVEILRECPACARGMPRIIASSAITALSAKQFRLGTDTTVPAVTIKPHNRTIALDHDWARPAGEREVPRDSTLRDTAGSSTCPNTSSNAPQPILRICRPEPSVRIRRHLINSLCAGLAGS